MRKTAGIILTIIMVMSFICSAASADEMPQPEGGKKFESDWAVQNAEIRIYYEEEGYRVSVECLPEEGKGIEWFYNCYYHEENDTLVSVSSSKQTYTFDPEDPDDLTYEAAEYEGFDDEDTVSVFSVDENGRLIWKDGHENMGQDLEFINIGRFEGDWKNDEEGVYVSIRWNGQEDSFSYDVVIQRMSDNPDNYTLFGMTGVYNEETDKLECIGTAVSYTKNADGVTEYYDDEETYDAFFSRMENGGILFEAANGIELEEDFDSQG